MPSERTYLIRTRRNATQACWMAALITALVIVGFAASPAGAEPPREVPAYYIIVNPKNSATSVGRAFVVQAFLRKIQTWSDGVTIRPIDLRYDSPVRHKFSEDALGRSSTAVRSYWMQMIFSGRSVPPPEGQSDGDVVGYVLRERGGIGYVSSSTELRGAKILTVK